MPETTEKTLADKIDSAVQRVTPFAYRMRRQGRRFMRRAMRRPRSVAEGPNLLPLLIQVLASFSKADGVLLEEEIDSSLGFLRYDYPEAVYSELRQLFRQALYEQQDLGAMAQKLSASLSADRKIMLGVQLYDLISQAGLKQEQVVAFYSFMSQLGMAAQAIDIVYQLNASEDSDQSIYQRGASPLESLSFGANGSSDVLIKSLGEQDRLLSFRYHDLILLKNYSAQSISVRGRPLLRGGFCRIYPGQRILVGDHVLTYQELAAYFNAKKNVSLPQIFVRVPRDADQVQLERAKSRESSLEITFGLKVRVKALRDVDAVINGVKLKAGKVVEATLDDRIVFHNDSEMDLLDLRRRARAMGGRFQLKAAKSEYLVSNNPSLLEADDILLSPGTSGDVLLKIFCDYDARTGILEVIEADRPIMVGDLVVRSGTAPLQDGDTIRIDVGQFLRCNFSERIIEEERNIIRSLEVADLNHRFGSGDVALDSISFAVNRGELVCVMGASGSGKSTLLKVLGGQLQPSNGKVLLNDQSLYDNLDDLKRYVSYVPQDDAFDENLTIGENLQFAAAVRSPHLSRRDRTRRLESKLVELGLSERKDSIVGSPVKKTLSGGERKRLNIGLDMIGNADVYLFDEPTSGLSSKDSEHVIEIVRGMAHNKIILVTIHQPSSKLFQMFHKAILFDRGGKLVFFGTPNDMLRYFAEAEHQHQFGADLGACPSCGTTRPEFIFDVLETPLRDISGDVIYEENNRGQLVAARRYSPDFWRDKYEAFRLIQDVKQVSLKREPVAPLPTEPEKKERRSPIRWHDEWTQLRTLLSRAFISKLRNRGNLRITIGAAPLLAVLVATLLRYSDSGSYDFASAFHIPMYLFLALLVAMFLSLTNSVDDVVADRPVLERERNLNIRLPYYILAKIMSLGVFALVQCTLFVLIGNYLLEVRGMFWIHLGLMFMTAVGSLALGLVVSSLVANAKSAANIVPLILIPQILMSGAMLKFEDMNRNLGFVYSMTRWFSEHPNDEQRKKMDSKLKVPFVCQFIGMRWSYEEMVVAQAKLNPLTRRQDKTQRQIEELVAIKKPTPEQKEHLSDLKETLAVLSGLEGKTADEVDSFLKKTDDIIAGKKRFNRADFKDATGPVTAEQLYTNQKVSDLISNAEMEQNDYRRGGKPNVFFGADKRYLGLKISVFTFNTIILIGSTVALLGLLLWILRRQLEVRRG
ncbi:MAG: ATP-binding cassette domain-containing protein [Verrucomicrobiota bacterium]|nr:ATP-binding cassette domain-containing protein [Verrucomicrobiota bacterium]